jgi:hypothetical protein
MADPVARFSPAPGLFVDRTQTSVTITGNMELYGEEATPDRAAQIQLWINQTWTQSFPDGYSVKCNVLVRYRGPGSEPSVATQIEAKNMSGPSHVDPFRAGFVREMTLNATESDAFTWTPAHEFGHILGMKDRYSEGIVSKIKGKFGGQRRSMVEAGYQGNLMGESWGALSSQNVADLSSENQPSPYWINDDDQVHDWIMAHSLAEIDALSAANKIAAIKTLMGGWISDQDMTAIGKICQSVTNPAHGSAIRQAIDLSDFTSIGQRTQMRVFYTRMP